MSRKYILSVAILFIYSILVIFGGMHHEPWRDEAHAWYTARENSLPVLFDNAKYEGVQILWYILLFPFAKLGFPYETMTFIHVAIAIAAVALLLFLGKPPYFAKVLFAFSYYMVYEYAVIARNYVLFVFLLFAIACVYSQRMNRPIIYGALLFLLFQVNVYSIIPAAVLTVFFIYDLLYLKKISRGSILAVLMMLCGGVLILLQFMGGSSLIDSSYFNDKDILQSSHIVLNNMVVPVSKYYFVPNPPTILLNTLYYSMLIFLAVFFAYISKNLRIFMMASISVLGEFFINLKAHEGTVRHHGLIFIIIFFYWWLFNQSKYSESRLQRSVRNLFTGLVSFFLAISVVFGIKTIISDFKYPFSGAKDMAQYIAAHNLGQMKTVSYEGGFGEAVLPYFKNKQFWFSEFNAMGSFDLNDRRYVELSRNLNINQAMLRIDKSFSRNEPLLLLLNQQLPDEWNNKYRLIHTSTSVSFWSNPTEDFWLYGNGLADDIIN